MTQQASANEVDSFGLTATIVGAVLGGLVGGLVGIWLGTSLLDEPTRTSDNPLDDIVVNTFEAMGGLLLVAAVTIAVICAGVALGVFVALRITKRTYAGTTALLCLVFDAAGVPGALLVATAVDNVLPDLSVVAGLAVLVLLVPIVARWSSLRVARPAANNPL